MCRWIAYLGSPITIDVLVTKPDHSLVDQSINARYLSLPDYPLAKQFRGHDFPTNGDGFGVAWAGRGGTIGQYHEVGPAWDSDNLHSLAEQIETSAVLAHVRAAPGGSIAEDNCHPFVHGGWMFQHNGFIGGFAKLKRDLTMDVDPALYPYIRGNSDTEVCFYLALTYGLATDPVGALQKLNERVERARAEQGVTEPFVGCFAASDGKQLVTMRVSSRKNLGGSPAPESPSLFHAQGAVDIRLADGTETTLPADTHLVCSEPLELDFSDHTWEQVADRTITVLRTGEAPAITAIPED
ncbi:class II glutamine amidotransferase [Actinomyces minihominis]|uniref:class II glutamine amidotransferase n=1 Tax=Actinomyces minihominis TaxID=2002838 RepID=UPI000C0741E4|nr:class II glutamine amidotransferase [Actinomyces minihominis]